MMHGRENSGIMDIVGYAPEKHTFAECPLFPVCTAGCVQSLGAQFFFFTHVQFAVRVPPKFVFKKKAIQTTNMVIWINLATTKKGLISNPWGFKVQTLNFCSLCRCLVFGVNFPCMQHATCSVTRL